MDHVPPSGIFLGCCINFGTNNFIALKDLPILSQAIQSIKCRGGDKVADYDDG